MKKQGVLLDEFSSADSNWHLKRTTEVLELTGSTPGGISDAEAEERLARYHLNVLLEKRKKPPWLMLVAQFKDVMILILLAAALVSGIVGEWQDAIVIIIIVVLNAVVGFLQEFRAEKAMTALKKMTAPKAMVVRNGHQKEIDASLLVPGDLVSLAAGGMVPADLRLLESHSLRTDEASLTGESAEVNKVTVPLTGTELMVGDRKNMAYKGTMVSYGRGTGVVIATGMQTEIGHIAQLLQENEALTPLQRRLADFGRKLSLAVLGICVLLFTTGLLRDEEPLNMLLIAISVAVAAIPEALPAVVTIALALGARRMVRQNALIRKLPAVETLGSVTYICTDKTGTLTQNRMTVTDVWYPQGAPKHLPFSSRTSLLMSMYLNHNVHENGSDALVGEPTEIALATYAKKHSNLNVENYPRIDELPFDADRKLMSTIHRYKDKYLVIVKGALESILNACNENVPAGVSQEAKRMAEKGLRVLAYAHRVLDDLPDTLAAATIEQQLEFSGLAGMMDPPRPEVLQAIKDCKTAGIIPVMITGDHPDTARTIATQLEMLDAPSDLVVTGRELLQMPISEFEEKVEHIRVYARVSPEQKLEIVKTLQKKGHYVAMTGDGVNDAPALRRANIGVAMGITGTDVSKEAAHMILLDDNFATIINAVREGRRIFDNIRRFVKYIMTGNGGEIWTIFLAPMAGLPIPLLPLHILWVNLVTDGLPALALANEPAGENVMDLPPRKPTESIFAQGLGLHVLWVGLLIGLLCLGVQAWAMRTGDPKWQTYVFTILCFSQMGHVLAVRSDYYFLFRQGIMTNLPLIGAVLLTFILQLAILYVPVLNDIFSVEPLTIRELLGCLLVASVVFHAVELEKGIRRWRSSH